jgi:hypothetical protein
MTGLALVAATVDMAKGGNRGGSVCEHCRIANQVIAIDRVSELKRRLLRILA